jgi:6-pyruvoyltetrahydropterin/6-carboxytetrahydropterin synthase
MLTLTKTFEFCASHRLSRPDWSDEENAKHFGKCANVNGHGHNYKLEVSVSGKLDPDKSMIIDASDLDKIVSECVISQLDHKNLDKDVTWLNGKLSTVEVVISEIWKRLEGPIESIAPNARLEKLKLAETTRIYAELSRD